MEQRINAGYTITDSIHVGGAEFVIGENPAYPAPYVTWEYTPSGGSFWGHYLPNRLAAVRDLLDRAGTEADIVEHRQGEHREAEPDDDTPPWDE